jgi:hypothetical protein
MPTFAPGQQRTATITLRNTAAWAAEFYVVTQVIGSSDGSTVGQSAPKTLAAGAQGDFASGPMTMPGTPGTYQLGGEVWGRSSSSAPWTRIATFSTLGEAVTIQQAVPTAQLVGVVWS